MSDVVLEVQDLEVRYGAVPAVRNLSIEVHQGEIVGLIGPNGAGKSTTLHAIMGAVPARHGDIRLRGRSIRGRKTESITRSGVARALATEPQFLLMDEPAAGLPDSEVPEFAAVIRAVRDDHGAGVLLIDHNMALIMDVCDRLQVLDQGRTLAEGTPAEIRGNLDVAAAYLGESAVNEDDVDA